VGNSEKNRAIITVVGQDRAGIIAEISTLFYQAGVNILDITQTILQEFFTMIMIVDLTGCTLDVRQLRTALAAKEASLQVKITLQHEDIFNYMHRI
jgi:ACT domain-containing protein